MECPLVALRAGNEFLAFSDDNTRQLSGLCGAALLLAGGLGCGRSLACHVYPLATGERREHRPVGCGAHGFG